VHEKDRSVDFKLSVNEPIVTLFKLLKAKFRLDEDQMRLVHNGREITKDLAANKHKPLVFLGILPPFNLLLVVDEISRFVLDPSHCGDSLVLSADRLGAGVETDSRWLTVRGTACFRKGKHYWTVLLHCCKSNNFFIGVCVDGVRYNNYLGNDEFGYSYYGCGNAYRKGNSSSYGQTLKSGDSIDVYLDMDARTLSFSRNGHDLGVAFRDLPSGMYPAFSLYTKGDHFSLTSFGTFNRS